MRFKIDIRQVIIYVTQTLCLYELAITLISYYIKQKLAGVVSKCKKIKIFINFLVFSNLYQMMPFLLQAPVLTFIQSFRRQFLGTLILHASRQKNLQS